MPPCEHPNPDECPNHGRAQARVNAGLYPHQNYWRVGRRNGRTIYAQIGSEPSDDDAQIGTMDTPALASAAVSAHNATLIPSAR